MVVVWLIEVVRWRRGRGDRNDELFLVFNAGMVVGDAGQYASFEYKLQSSDTWSMSYFMSPFSSKSLSATSLSELAELAELGGSSCRFTDDDILLATQIFLFLILRFAILLFSRSVNTYGLFVWLLLLLLPAFDWFFHWVFFSTFFAVSLFSHLSLYLKIN